MMQVKPEIREDKNDAVKLLVEKVSRTHQAQEPRPLQYGKYKDTPGRVFFM